MYVWGDTKEQNAQKKSQNRSYLPIFDRSKLESSSLLHIRRNTFYTQCKKFILQESRNIHKISKFLYPRFTCEI